MENAHCKGSIFVVDDDAGIRDALEELLADEGYLVTTAIHGQDALQKLRAAEPKPCLILLDLMMPIMNGAQFYTEQQQDPSIATVPVVVISADGNLKQKALPFSGEYLTKPMRLDQVLDVIQKHC